MCLENEELMMLPPRAVYCRTSHYGRSLWLLHFRWITPEMNCLVCPITGRAKKSICSEITLASARCEFTYGIGAWVYVEDVLSPSSSWSERNSLPYLIPLHECPCLGIHCLLMLSIQCTHCTSSSAREGIKIYCSSQPNIFKIEWCARKDFWNSRS